MFLLGLWETPSALSLMTDGRRIAILGGHALKLCMILPAQRMGSNGQESIGRILLTIGADEKAAMI